MDLNILKDLENLYNEIGQMANGERFGANHSDYKPDINRFERLVYSFYEIVSTLELPINTMRDVIDGQNSLNRQFMVLRCVSDNNKYETMKNIFSEIEQLMNCLY